MKGRLAKTARRIGASFFWRGIMTPACKYIWKYALFFCLLGLPARAQESQFLPEIDAYMKLNSTFRAYLESNDYIDDGDSTHLTIDTTLTPPSTTFTITHSPHLTSSTRTI